MRYKQVSVEAIGYELGPYVATSEDIESHLAPLYQQFHIRPGQLEAWTGIRERRFWEREHSFAEHAANAGADALRKAGVDSSSIGMLVYCGVGRDHLEPATASEVAHRLQLPATAQILDISNACLGVLNGMLQVANAIELGQIQSGLVVSCESSRNIIEQTIAELLERPALDKIRHSLATLTGGSGAVGVVLTHSSIAQHQHRLLGGVCRHASEHHRLCLWSPAMDFSPSRRQQMSTDAVGVLQHGTVLGEATWQAFKEELGWSEHRPDKVICHQVGSAHQKSILSSLRLSPERDFTTFATLGNMGTVSLPVTAAIAAEQGFFRKGDTVGLLGIGSGLNCMMLGLTW